MDSLILHIRFRTSCALYFGWDYFTAKYKEKHKYSVIVVSAILDIKKTFY